MTKTKSPLVTFFVFSYNQEQYIEEACRAALAQDYTPLEIIFSDDCSSDQTFELIKKIVKDYKGLHQVKINRNKSNLGLINHVNKSFEISSGELIVSAAGDDISLPNRVARLMDAYNESGREALVIHSSAEKINNNNDDLGLFIPPIIDRPMTSNELAGCLSLYIGATGAWNRSLYKEFGPICFQDAYEDLVLGFRASIRNLLVYVDEPLVRYRVGVGINTRPKISLLEFRSRIAIRKKLLKMALDVYEQRLRDLARTEQCARDDTLKARLIRNINFQNNKLLFYSKPSALLLCLFTKEAIGALRALYSELPYLAGLSK